MTKQEILKQFAQIITPNRDEKSLKKDIKNMSNDFFWNKDKLTAIGRRVYNNLIKR